MTAYYNEIDPFAAAWLRELIEAGEIAPGVVDTRSIEDVTPNDLDGFTQCHFFAGIGIWSAALRGAGWADDRPVWTGSCPCQPFSSAGQGVGFADERHLWPAWYHLITQRGPSVVFGEQVASKDGLAWLDLVQADMEAADFAFGALDLCAAGFGAPHIRQRTFFVGLADAAHGNGRCGERGTETRAWAHEQRRRGFTGGGNHGGLAVGVGAGLERHAGYGDGSDEPRRIDARQDGPATAQSVAGGVAYNDGRNARAEGLQRDDQHGCEPHNGGVMRLGREGVGSDDIAGLDGPGPTNGSWRAADWLFCRDGKWRPVRPGTFPLVNGAPARVGRLRGYGNGIVKDVAQGFIETVMECIG